MLRLLLLLLAGLSLAVAIVFNQPILYLAGAVLAVIVIAVLAYRVFQSRKVRQAREARHEAAKEDSLQSLGIVGIRPRGAGEEAETTEPAMPAVPGRAETTGGESVHGVSPATVRIKTVSEVTSGDERLKKDLLGPYLHALQAALSATTVVLLRHDDGLKYTIEGIVSKNSYARTHGFFHTKQPLPSPPPDTGQVALVRVGEKGMPTTNLGYYLEPIAVRQLAAVGVPHAPAGTGYILLADTMEEGGLGTRRQRMLLAEFANLLGNILDVHDTSEAEEETEEVMPEVRPRRDIIAEEMRHARAAEEDMALALVYLNRAEAVSEQGAASVLATEEALQERLRQAQDERVVRVERFGELTFGVFYRGPILALESWAVELQGSLADSGGVLEDGVCIGIAVMQKRHEGPDALRADATEALREALETGSCTILE